MSTPPTTEVWVAWGDSEMAGRGDPADLAAVLPGYPPASGLFMLRTGAQWQALAEPCADGTYPPVGVGPPGMFGYLRGQTIGKDVGVVNGGVGGSTTAEWLPGTANFNALLARAEAAVGRDGNYLGGFLCYIGANDAAAGTTDWTANTAATLAALRAALGNVPVVFAVLPPTVPGPGGGATTYPTWAAIRAQQQAWASADRLAVDVPEGHWIEAYNLHLNTEGNYLLAQAMEAAL